jgi:hypothetical protein
MSNFFKIVGLLIVLFGLVDMGLLAHGISLHRILGISTPRMIGPFSYMFEIGYGALTMVVANYLRRPREKNLQIIDLSDPFIGGETRYAAVEKQPATFKVELQDITLAFLWGSVVVAIYMVVFVRYAPSGDALLFASETLEPQTRKALVMGSILAVMLPLLYGIFGMKLRESLSVTAMLSGAAITALMLGVAVYSSPKLGYGLYGGAFMQQAYTAIGHPDGLPDDWSVEGELMARLRLAGRMR